MKESKNQKKKVEEAKECSDQFVYLKPPKARINCYNCLFLRGKLPVEDGAFQWHKYKVKCVKGMLTTQKGINKEFSLSRKTKGNFSYKTFDFAKDCMFFFDMTFGTDEYDPE